MPRTAKQLVNLVLQNATDIKALEKLCTPDCSYTSLCYSNPALKKLMPYAGVHDREGPEAIRYTFATVGHIWHNEDFQVIASFSDEGSSDRSGPGQDEGLVNVAVFGRFTYRSSVLGKKYESPFSVWCVIDMRLGEEGEGNLEGKGRLVSMQFMEDTFGTGATFEKEGRKTYEVEKGEDVVIGLTGEDVGKGDDA